MSIVTDELGSAMFNILESYCGDVEKNVRQVVAAVTAESTKRLRETSPKRTGEYAKSWKSRITRNAATYMETTVYQDKKPGLAHLLEKGSANTDKRPWSVEAKPHIAAVEEWAEKEVVERLAARLS